MKKLNVFIAFLIVISFASCERISNKIDRNGSIVGSTAGDWIVIKQSGGVITDVWLLRDVMVQSEDGSDGWLFKDSRGDMVNVSGDTKATRVKSNTSEIFNKYIEYHMEFETLTYQEKLNKEKITASH